MQQIKSSKLDKFTPRIVEKKDDYVRVEYQSPILGVGNQMIYFQGFVMNLHC